MRNYNGPRWGAFSEHRPTLEQLMYRIELSTRLLETHPEHKDLLMRRIDKTKKLIQEMKQEEKDAAICHWIPWSYWPEVGPVDRGRAPYLWVITPEPPPPNNGARLLPFLDPSFNPVDTG